MNIEQALVPVTVDGKPAKRACVSHRAVDQSAFPSTPKTSPRPEPLNDEMVAAILKGRGLRGWWHAARVARVLGLFTLYIFLDTYDIRAGFNRRMIERLRRRPSQEV